MQNFKKIIYLVFLASLPLLTGCSSDDEDNDDNNSGINLSGEPHTYDITVTGGQFDGQNFTGEITNQFNEQTGDADFSAYSQIPNSDVKAITFLISDNDIMFAGAFVHHDNGNTENFGDQDMSSEMSIVLSPPGDDDYQSVTGEVQLTNTHFSSAPNELGGYAAYQVNFDGTFHNIDQDEDVNISGTITINLPDENL